jgi:hypothetical protein
VHSYQATWGSPLLSPSRFWAGVDRHRHRYCLLMQPAKLAQDIAGLAATQGGLRPVLVAIDGPDTSGKTTLADGIARACEVSGRHTVRIEADHFLYEPERRYQQGRDSPIGFFEDSYDLDTLTRRVPVFWGCVQQLGRHDNKEVRVVMT